MCFEMFRVNSASAVFGIRCGGALASVWSDMVDDGTEADHTGNVPAQQVWRIQEC